MKQEGDFVVPELTRTSLRAEIQGALNYGYRAADNAARRLIRTADFREIAQLCTGDPTALVAILRARGYDVPERYTRPAQPILETP